MTGHVTSLLLISSAMDILFSVNLLLLGLSGSARGSGCGRHRSAGCFQLCCDHAGYHFSGHYDVATEGIDHESQRRTDIALCIFAQQHSRIIVKVHGESLLILLISPLF